MIPVVPSEKNLCAASGITGCYPIQPHSVCTRKIRLGSSAFRATFFSKIIGNARPFLLDVLSSDVTVIGAREIRPGSFRGASPVIGILVA